MEKIHQDTMWPINPQVTSLEVEQVAHPVGPQRDSYYILTWFKLDTISNETTHRCEVIFRFHDVDSNKRANLFKGSYKECYDYIENIVKETLKGG